MTEANQAAAVTTATSSTGQTTQTASSADAVSSTTATDTVSGASNTDTVTGANAAETTKSLMFNQEGADTAAGANKTDTVDGAEKKDETQTEVNYEFTAPEGFPLEAENKEWLTGFAKELKLPPDQAQKLVDKYVELQFKQQEAAIEVVENWKKEFESDPTYGGKNLTTSIRKADTVVREFGDAELMKFFTERGLGNNVVIGRFLNKIADAMGEDNISKLSSSTSKKELSMAQKMWPDMKPV